MNYRFTLYFGTELDSMGNPIANPPILAIRQLAVALFGGVSMSSVMGSWRNDAGDVASEESIRLEIITHGLDARNKAFKLANFIRWSLNQESVLMTIEELPQNSVFYVNESNEE